MVRGSSVAIAAAILCPAAAATDGLVLADKQIISGPSFPYVKYEFEFDSCGTVENSSGEVEGVYGGSVLDRGRVLWYSHQAEPLYQVSTSEGWWEVDECNEKKMKEQAVTDANRSEVYQELCEIVRGTVNYNELGQDQTCEDCPPAGFPNDCDCDGVLDPDDDPCTPSNGPVDSDGDGIPDAMDPDDDNDGIPDWQDNDDDGDGIPDHLEDNDNDGFPNGLDGDIDGDGIPNWQDDDVDGDGVPDGQDDDVDGDGIPNSNDGDIDADGIPNAGDGDADGDGVPNGEDADIDGDGVPNSDDTDADGDGIPNDQDDDIDGDGVPNGTDLDDDGDLVPDDTDESPRGESEGPRGEGPTGEPPPPEPGNDGESKCLDICDGPATRAQLDAQPRCDYDRDGIINQYDYFQYLEGSCNEESEEVEYYLRECPDCDECIDVTALKSRFEAVAGIDIRVPASTATGINFEIPWPENGTIGVKSIYLDRSLNWGNDSRFADLAGKLEILRQIFRAGVLFLVGMSLVRRALNVIGGR